MKLRIPKKQSTREGLIFVAMFVVTAASIGVYQLIHAQPVGKPLTQEVPAASKDQKAPFYSMFISSAKTISTDEQAQTKQVTVEVAIVNPTNSPMQIAPGLQMLLIDGDGIGYPMTAKYLPVGTVIGGQLDAGATKTYPIDFELPINSTPKAFNFQLDASYKPIQLDI
ncbi:MAG: hypothetical protein ACXWLH_01230 [Candidatus Saccharimonadales bacterium]